MAHRLFGKALQFLLGDLDIEAFENWMSKRYDEFITIRETAEVVKAAYPTTP